MATRSAKLYQGEDQSPVVDYTDLVIWEESEFGTRAHNGEGSASNVVIRDPLGETGSAASLPAGLSFKTLPSKSLFIIEVDSSYLFRGRVGIKNYTRDGQHVERYRQVDVSLHDTNWDLDNIFVHGYARPAETDKARAQGIIASYLSGDPRPTTALNGSNYISSSNLVTLPEQEYNRTSPLGMLREVATAANKQLFITGDTIGGGSLFYDGNDSTAYACPFTISDRPSEVAANPGTYFPPIWNVGPSSTEDGSEQVDEIVYFYGTGDDDYVTVHSDIIHTQYGHASVTISDDTAETAEVATARAEAILAHRRLEDRTYNVSIGPLTDAQVVQIKHGQTINIKARAIPDADDAFRLMRIGQCRYTTPVVGTWFAHLQLGRPWKLQPYSTGPVLVPKVGSFDSSDCEPSTCVDTFGRTEASGWGTSEILGLAWTESGSGSTIPSQGRAYLPPLNGSSASNSQYLDFTTLTLPVEVLMAVELRAPIAGNVGGTGTNRLDVQVDVRASLAATSTGLFRWNITGIDQDDEGSAIGMIAGIKNGSGVTTDSFIIPGTFTNGGRLWVVLRGEESTVKVKAWYAGESEPTDWTHEHSVGDSSSGLRYLVITNRTTSDDLGGEIWVNSVCMRAGASCSNGFCGGCGPESGDFVTRVLIGYGDGSTTAFSIPYASGYAPGSLSVTVDALAQNVIESDPASGQFSLEFAPEADEVIHASWREP